jgi:amino acid adenylation domain-containing protein
MRNTNTRVDGELSVVSPALSASCRVAQSCEARRTRLKVSASLLQRLRELAEGQDVTLCLALLSGWAVLLARRTGQEEVVVTAQVAKRRSLDNELFLAPFDDTMLLRIWVQEHMAIEQLLRDVKKAAMQACAEQDSSLERPKPGCNRAQVFGMLLGQNDTRATLIASAEFQVDGWRPSEVSIENPKPPLAVSLYLSCEEDDVWAGLEYPDDPCEREVIGQFAACWEPFLEGMVANIERPIGQLPTLTPMERERVLYGFNRAPVAYPRDQLIHELFEEQVRRTPDATAVVHEHESLTYLELNSKANLLARYLRSYGIGPDQLVGLCVDRGLAMVVGLLGILKAGGAYLPLDPTYPFERLAYMIKDAAPRVLLTQERLQSVLPSTCGPVVLLDSEIADCENAVHGNLDPRELKLTSRHLAYVIYTSGSTGEPKGVQAEHRGMVNRIAAQEMIGGFLDDDICCHKTSIGFVDAIFEILGPLSFGRPLVVASAAVSKDVQQLASLIEREHVTRLVTVPSLAQSLLQSGRSMRSLRCLRSWTLSGEELKPDLLWELQRQLPECVFTNLYGSSEVAADATFYISGNEKHVKVPIGRPIANTQIYILNRVLQPVPIGVVGEIYVGGVGVARGYLNRPELTAQRFLPDPFNPDRQARLYKSGDLGRWRSDGMIEYLGRSDLQVKMRGYRIELGEIEAQLARHPQLKEAAVLAREDIPGQPRLVAYVTPREESGPEGRTGPSPADLRAYLGAILPEYMVPSAFVTLASLPLTLSGKVDRRALPAPDVLAYASGPYDAPRGQTEKLLAGIWQELLRTERVGRHDNFFELGGHSLLVVQMLERLRQAGLSADVSRVFASPTLAQMASSLTNEPLEQNDVPTNPIPLGSEAITPQMLTLVALEVAHIDRIVQSVPGGAANIQDIYPLAPLQEGMLFHRLLNDNRGDCYVLPMLFSLTSQARLKDLIRALQEVIDRHDILRSAMHWEGLPRPVQVVYRQATLPVEELVLVRDRDPVEQLKEHMRPERQKLELHRAPLLRLQVAASPLSERWYALLQIHHLVRDDESLRILIAEVMTCVDGGAQSLPAPGSYRNHVARVLAYARTHHAETFFRRKLGDIDGPTIAFGLSDVHEDGSRQLEARRTLESALSKRIRLQAQRFGVSAATLFHAVWALVVSCTSGRDDVVYGTVLLGRMHGGLGPQRILGMCMNTVPLRLRLRDVAVKGLVEQAQRELVELFGHEQASLAEAQRCSGNSDSGQLFNTLLNYLPSVSIDETKRPKMAAGIQVLASQEWTNYPIALTVDDQAEGFDLTMQTDDRIDPWRMLGYTATAIQSLVDALETAPQTSALSLQVLPDPERDQVISAFNATHAHYPEQKLIHELFEQQVQRTPDVVAVTCESQFLTYADLNCRANQLAHYLIAQGVQVGECIPIVMPRCEQMLIAELAVLKSGAVYVPLDPLLPQDRQTFILRDCDARWIIAEKGVCAGLERQSMQRIDYSEAAFGLRDLPSDNPNRQMNPRSPAYVMYTSGSTGVPKGVVVPHRAVNRLVINNAYAKIEPTDRIAHCSNPAFDASTFEVWGALLNGASILVVPQALVLEVRRFADLLIEQRVTVLWLTVGLFTQYQDALAEVFGQLRYLLTGGDTVDPVAIRRVLRNSRPRYLLNAYGPTECTTFSTTYLIESIDENATNISIGRPISNTQVYILNGHLQPVPIGVCGEIYIGGAGVALGYLNRPELTGERFINDPFSTDPDARLYRSGDLGRWRADGNIDFLGRNDSQVKLRGFRIELGEIEAQLARHERVKEAAVVVRDDVNGEKRLVAYVTQRSGGDLLSVEALRTHLQAVVPEYMVPTALVILESLPLTANGKLDRAALPVPELGAYASEKYEAPQGRVEEILAGIWEELLGLEQVGRDDNFFRLGGHSLLAVQLIGRVRSSLSIELSMRLLFDFPTVKQLSAQVERLGYEHFVNDIERGGEEMEELLESVTAMPDSEVQKLMRDLRTRATP